MTAVSRAREAYCALADREVVFARLIEVYGRPDPFVWHDGGRTGSSKFAALALHVVSQRISALSAFAVFDRITASAGGVPTPEAIVGLGAVRLRACGLSPAKSTYLLNIARAQTDGVLDVEAMEGLGDGEVIETLTAVEGIGRWTAQSFLIRQLHRPDVLPESDMGARSAIGEQWRLATLPTAGAVRARAATWAPYRSYAAALLWRSLRPPGEPSDPKERALLKLRAATGSG